MMTPRLPTSSVEVSLLLLFLCPVPRRLQLFSCPELVPYLYKFLDCLGYQPQTLFVDFPTNK